MQLTTREFVVLFDAWADTMSRSRDELIRLDSVGGDGDLGLAMDDGFTAVRDALHNSDETDIGRLFFNAGKTMSVSASSSLGTLLAFGFMEVGKRFKGRSELRCSELAEVLAAIEDAIKTRGKAELGDKTFLDALHPAVVVLSSEPFDNDVFGALHEAAMAAQAGADATADMVAKHGRIAVRGEDSKGIIDPGAVVAALLVNTLAETLGAIC